MNARNFSKRILLAAALLMLTVAVTACSQGTTLTPTVEPSATPPATPTHTPEPLIRVSPAEGSADTLVTITGQGWRPGDTIFVYMQDPSLAALSPSDYGAVMIAAAVDADGRFVAAFAFPQDARWTDLPAVLLTAHSPATGQSAQRAFRVHPLPQTPTATSSPTAQPTATPTATQPAPMATQTNTPWPVISYWRAEYFSNRDLAGSPVFVRDDVEVNYDWGAFSPATSIPSDNFSVRWTRLLTLAAGSYRFSVRADDGVRVWLDGETIVDQWHDAVDAAYSADRTLNAGTHAIRIEYYESRGNARIQFGWERTSDFPQWRAEYFSNPALSGAAAVIRNDADVYFDWGGAAPAAGLPSDGFSARWTRTLSFETATYRFHARVDDGMRLYVDGAIVIDAWSDGAQREVTGDVGLAAGYHNLRIEYYERNGGALIQVWWEKLQPTYPDWKGEYWSNANLAGSPVLVRNDATVDFDWGQSTPAQNVPADNFSARWTRSSNFDGATYRFHVTVDDGARVWVDDRLVVDEWRDGSLREITADTNLSYGPHRVKVEFYERIGNARIQVWWEKFTPTYSDWRGEYFPTQDLSGNSLIVRNDKAIDFNWAKAAPVAGLPIDGFSVRWSRALTFAAGAYRFYARADDGVRISIDGAPLLDEWHDNQAQNTYTAERNLAAGAHSVVVEYYDRIGKAEIKVWWEPVPPTPTPTPTAGAAETATQPPPSVEPTATTPPPSVTPTPTATSTATPSATPPQPLTGVRLSELLPLPQMIDWNGDGEVSVRDEWIELTNVGLLAVDISGWSLDSASDGGVYTFPAGTSIEPGEFVVWYRSDTGLRLKDAGDGVRLLGPSGQVFDLVIYDSLGPDRSYSRDEGGVWHADWSPSPGGPNLPPSEPGNLNSRKGIGWYR